MRRKRLKHIAFTLCHMFCGWRLINSFAAFEKLGSGTLQINVLTAECIFNGEAIASLKIAGELQAWLREECLDNNIPLGNLEKAEVTAKLELSKIPSKEKSIRGQIFYKSNQEYTAPTLFQLHIKCESIIRTASAEYRGEYSDIEEWPEEWAGVISA